MASSRSSSSENILSEKTDVCLANAIVKTGIGFGAGVVLSAVLFRRRSFPVWLGIGSGLGASYSDCQRTFNPVNVPGYRFSDVHPSTSQNHSKDQPGVASAKHLL
ncbi:hypothetical protein CROQUDRAFT_663944 [Cronartium quercuum f. sp. fusiforme G11]|uniref:MICOS complex subunit MIC10 n=1 Tax=Cronartium quercuum f. sp. fusiforme G11 TaxID=708437 RepID=A0A9P6T8D1_9BASI|nr:hypothetical protein CROQUDRAFT_663944 [Cronartium quercuum f. sp. fusiforme G11]